jgi:hypothetical protein
MALNLVTRYEIIGGSSRYSIPLPRKQALIKYKKLKSEGIKDLRFHKVYLKTLN